jgi:hypothetical protein
VVLQVDPLKWNSIRFPLATTRFGIHRSLENLKFPGDHQPRQDHRAAFNRVSFVPYAAPGE